jgi:hypothetical protein
LLRIPDLDFVGDTDSPDSLRDNILSPLDYGNPSVFSYKDAYDLVLGERDWRKPILKLLGWLDNLQAGKSKEEDDFFRARAYIREVLEGILGHCEMKYRRGYFQ